MGLWSKGLTRAQMGNKRLEDAHVNIEKMEIICDYIKGVYHKDCSYKFTSSNSMIWTINDCTLPEFQFDSFITSKERDIFDKLHHEIYKASLNKKYSTPQQINFKLILSGFDHVNSLCKDSIERVFDIMSF